ncbi:MAG TPA: glycoside-pentoside-hexuronide (GPH):cation symporter [Solirubrobacterales bacterium]|jgi:glucuronide carrier protein|nr:glycoside-pentoside-hexuronide (GPH):cation symporter [Solirubrobacterales bacterium]
MSDQAPAKTLTTWRYLGYGAGDVANNLTFSMASAFLLIYYTDVAGIAAGTAGTIFLVVRIWGGLTDLFAGARVDRTSTRWGRFRPYILFGAIPLMATNIALFTIPSGLSDSGKVIFAYASYALFSLAYSFVNIPYGSLAAAMTQRPDERAKISTIRIIAASVTILLLAIVVSPQIEGSDDLQRSLTITVIVIAVVGVALYLWCFLSTRETVARSTQKVSLKGTLSMMRQNRPLILLCSASLLFLTGMFSLQAVGVYYARDVLGDAGYYIVLTTVQTVGMILAALAVPNAVEALGKRRAYLASGVIAVVGGIGVAMAPGSVPAIGITAFGVLGFGMGAINTLVFALQADTVDYGEWKSGVRAEGSNYAVLSFTRKTGQGVGGAAAAYTIGLGGYVSGAESQPDGAETAIRVAAGALPAGFILASAAVMLAYPLSERVFRRIVAELAERRAEAEPAPDPNPLVEGAAE